MSNLQRKRKHLRRLRIRNITLNTVCILLVLGGISWTMNHFWKYVNHEITNDATVDQYVAPLNIRIPGYIKDIHFTEHQPVHAGDTLLVLGNREYLIKAEDTEAALMDAKGSKDVLHSGIQTSHVNIAIQEANIAETKAKFRQLKEEYKRYANLLADESVAQQQYEKVKSNYEVTQIAHIYIGQKVRIKVDAFKDRVFNGTVETISEATGSKYALIPTDNAAGNFVKARQRIPVRIKLDDTTLEEMASLRAGMMVETEALRK